MFLIKQLIILLNLYILLKIKKGLKLLKIISTLIILLSFSACGEFISQQPKDNTVSVPINNSTNHNPISNPTKNPTTVIDHTKTMEQKTSIETMSPKEIPTATQNTDNPNPTSQEEPLNNQNPTELLSIGRAVLISPHVSVITPQQWYVSSMSSDRTYAGTLRSFRRIDNEPSRLHWGFEKPLALETCEYSWERKVIANNDSIYCESTPSSTQVQEKPVRNYLSHHFETVSNTTKYGREKVLVQEKNLATTTPVSDLATLENLCGRNQVQRQSGHIGSLKSEIYFCQRSRLSETTPFFAGFEWIVLTEIKVPNKNLNIRAIYSLQPRPLLYGSQQGSLNYALNQAQTFFSQFILIQ